MKSDKDPSRSIQARPSGQAEVTHVERADYVVEPYAESSDLLRRWSVLRRRIWLVPLAFAAGVGVAWYTRGNQEPVYQASATVRFRDTRATLTSGVGNNADASSWRFDPVTSQIELLNARSTRERAVDEGMLQLRPVGPAAVEWISGFSAPKLALADTLALHFEPDSVLARFGQRQAKAGYGEPIDLGQLAFIVASRPTVGAAKFAVSTREAAIASIGSVSVSRRPETDIGDFVLLGPDSAFVPRVLNALTLSLQALSRMSDQAFAGARRKFLDEQLRTTDSILETKRGQLSAFRIRTKTFDARQQASQEQQTLGAIRTRREEIAADKQVFEALLGTAVAAQSSGDMNRIKSLISAPGIGSNPLLADLYARLQLLSSRRDSLTQGPFASASTNPDVQFLDTQITAIAEQFIQAVRSQIATFEARINALDGLAAKTASTVSGLPITQAEEERLQQEASATQVLADQLRQEQQRARISEVAEGGKVEVIDLAPPAAFSVPQSARRKLLFGGLVSALICIGLIFLFDELNTSLRRKHDVEQLLSLPTLGSIPSLTRGTSVSRRLPGMRAKNVSNGKGVSLATYAESPVFESYRAIRTSLIFSNAVESLRTIAVTSASPGDGKSTTVANLAMAFAQQDLRVLAIDCDFRRGSLHRIFKVPRSPGFTNAIATGANLASVVQETSIPNLSVLTTGVHPPNPGELLGSHRVRDLLSEAGAQYDLLIIDTPPVLAAADASVIGSMVDGVILLIRVGVTTKSAARAAQERLQLVGARILGTVLNDPTEILESSEQYYYYDYSASGSGSKT